MQADLSHWPSGPAHFQSQIGKRLQDDQKLTKINRFHGPLLPVGLKLFSFLVLKMGRPSKMNHDGSLFIQKNLTMQEPRNYLMVVRGNRIGKEGQQ